MTEKPPKYLSKTSAAWWSRVVKEFRLNSGGEQQVLAEAAESLDRIAECREAIKRDGLFVKGDRGMVVHSAARLEKEHRSLVLQACRQLGISNPER